MGHRQLGIFTPQGAIGAGVSIASAAAQGGTNPMADIQAVMALVGLLGSKPSNDSAYAEFSAGPVPQFTGTGGSEADPETTAAAQKMGEALSLVIGKAVAQGVTFRSPKFNVEVGRRDPSAITDGLGDGKHFVDPLSPVGDPQAAALAAWQWLQQYASGGTAPPPSDYHATATPGAVGSTDPLPGGSDYHSVQASAPSNAPVTTSTAAPPAPPAQASLFSMPLIVFGAFALVALLVSQSSQE